MMGKGTLNFTIGENFGNIIIDIAREKLYDNDLDKALGVLKSSLVSLQEELAFKILVGDKTLEVNVETQDVYVKPGNKKEVDKFKSLYIKREDMVKESKYFYESIKYFYKDLKKDSFITTAPSEILEWVIDHKEESIRNMIEEKGSYIKIMLENASKFIHNSYKRALMHEKMDKMAKKYKVENLFDEPLLAVPKEVFGLKTLVADMYKTKYFTYIEEFEEENKDIEDFIHHEVDIAKIAEKGIAPVDIKEGYSAGWLSPDGTFYGLNGQIANMLHQQISDMLLEEGVIPEDFKDDDKATNPDHWLGLKGWVKIQGNWILFEGYDYGIKGKEDNPITEEQIKQLYEYGALCHKGVLRLGYEQETVSAIRLTMIDKVQFRMRYFNI